MMIQSKIDVALDNLFDLEKNDEIYSKYIDSLYLLGQLFTNQ